MLYTDEDFVRMKSDRDFRRQYYWTVAMHAKRKALTAHERAQKASSEHGQHILNMGRVYERFSASILENLEQLVALDDPKPMETFRQTSP